MTNPADFLVWKSQNVPGACVLSSLAGVDDIWQLWEGYPRAADFPSDATYPFDPDFPNDLLLTDNLINSDMLIVGSPRLADFMRSHNVLHVEFLPVTIVNHKSRPAGGYFIINPIYPVDCLDAKASKAEWGEVDEEAIASVEHLVIDEKSVPDDRQLFRPKSFYDVILVRRTLAQAIDGQGFSGIRWVELCDYPEI